MTPDTNPTARCQKNGFGYSRWPLTTFAIAKPTGESIGGPGANLLKYSDLAVLALALPIFMLGEYPLLGWAGAAFGWGGQRLIQYLIQKKAEQTEDVKGFFRLMAGSLIGRSWFLVVSIFVVGLIDRPSGLAAAVLSAIVFTSYLVITLIDRPTSDPVEGK